MYRRLVGYMKDYFHDDALGRKRAFYFLPWHFEFFCRYRRYPADVYQSLRRDDAPLMSFREGLVNEQVRTALAVALQSFVLRGYPVTPCALGISPVTSYSDVKRDPVTKHHILMERERERRKNVCTIQPSCAIFCLHPCCCCRENSNGCGIHLSLIHISEPTRPY